MHNAANAFPQVPRWLTLRNSVRWARNPVRGLDQILARYGHTVRLYLGGVRPTLVTRDPALVQHVLQKHHRRYRKSDLTHGLVRYLGRGLLTNEGADWLRQRRLIQPGFHRQRLAGLGRLMCAAADEWVAEARAQLGPDGTAVLDAHAALTQVAFRIVARSVFSVSLPEAELARLAHVITALQAFYVRTVRQPYLRPWHWLAGAYRRHDRLSQELRRQVQGYVHQRRASESEENPAGAPDDLLQMLLEARYEDDGAPMAEAQLLDEINILLVAGHETSANALAWGLYLLARHPEAQARVRQEAAQALPAGQAPELADLARLPYLGQVVQETLRLFPPAWVLDRVAAEADEFAGQPIAPGTLFSLYLYGLHRHPDLWPEPDAFRPERFAPGATPPVPAYAYLPFGGGPRLCVGNHFALAEIQLVLLQTLRSFAVEPAHDAPPDLQPLVTLRPRGALPLRFRAR